MTSVVIYQTKEGTFTGFDVLGHAGFADAGEDIVCAAISALVINTVNSIEKLTDSTVLVQEDQKSGKISCRFPVKLNGDGVLLMRSLHLGVNEIAKRYGKKYLKVITKEV